MKRDKRFRLFADAKLQSSLCLRVACYWLICQATLSVTLLALLSFETASAANSTGSPWRLIIPGLLASLVVLPLVLLDLLLFSNKFAGPMVRFRRYLRELNQGQEHGPIHFRRGDYYLDLCEQFNRFREKQTKPQPEPAPWPEHQGTPQFQEPVPARLRNLAPQPTGQAGDTLDTEQTEQTEPVSAVSAYGD